MKSLTSISFLCAAALTWGCGSAADKSPSPGLESGTATPEAPTDSASDSSLPGSSAPTSSASGAGTTTGVPGGGDTAGVPQVDDTTEPAEQGTNAATRSRRLALGWSHACATDQRGEAVCGGWDWNQPALTSDCISGNLIEGVFTPPAAQLTYVDAEAYATCGIERDTQVLKCWGDHYVSDALTDLQDVVQVTVSVSQACALTLDDQVVCNGPRVIPELSGLAAVEVAMGHDHICALLSGGQIACHYFGSEQFDFGQADAPAGRYKFLAAGRFTTCAIDEDDQLQCWGQNEQGQATPPLGHYVSADVGPKHGCGVLESHEIVCWGANDNGESTPPAGEFEEVAVGSDFSCGLTSSNTVECWGVPYCMNTALPSEL